MRLDEIFPGCTYRKGHTTRQVLKIHHPTIYPSDDYVIYLEINGDETKEGKCQRKAFAKWIREKVK